VNENFAQHEAIIWYSKDSQAENYHQSIQWWFGKKAHH